VSGKSWRKQGEAEGQQEGWQMAGSGWVQSGKREENRPMQPSGQAAMEGMHAANTK